MSISITTEQAEVLQRIVARAWEDEGFKAALLSDASAALAAEGVALPDGLTLRVHEQTPHTFHVILPPKPTDALSDEALEAAAGGMITQKQTQSPDHREYYNWNTGLTIHHITTGPERSPDITSLFDPAAQKKEWQLP